MAGSARVRAGAWTVGATLLGALAGCGARDPAPPAAPRPVVAAAAQPPGTAGAPTYHGEIRARDDAALAFRVGGKLVVRRVRLGDAVRHGDLLARLDSADLDREVAIDAANLAAAESHVELAQSQLARATAEHAQGLASTADLDQATDAVRAAVAARDAGRERLELAHQQQGYSELHADRDGWITREDAQPGQVVAAGQSVFGFAASSEREVVIEVPETGRGAVARGAALRVTLPALPGWTFRAVVREVAAAADPASRTFTVRAVLFDPGPEVALGMTADATPEPSAASAPGAAAGEAMVPATALFHAGERPAVWVVDPEHGRVALRPVELGAYRGRSVTLRGVQPGEVVVVAGVHTLAANDHVAVIAPLHPDDGQP